MDKSKNHPQEIKDVAIIGAGPVGLFAVFECGMVGLSCYVIDALPEIGGQCQALYPDKPIYDIPAYPKIMAGDLVEKLKQQAAAFNPKYITGQQIVAINDEKGLWQLTTSHGQDIYARTIVIAGGAGSFGPNKPPLKDIEEYEDHSVLYFIREIEKFENKRVVVAGGGDSAVDWALTLQPLAKHVHLVHRRDKFRASPANVEKLKKLAGAGRLSLETPYQLKSLNGEKGVLSQVALQGKDGEEKILSADYLLPFYGLATDLGPIAHWGLAMKHHTIQVDPTTCQTNKKGIYAIGDIAAYKNKLKLILTGFSECAFAAHDIYKYLRPDTPLHFEYSTTKGLPTTPKS